MKENNQCDFRTCYQIARGITQTDKYREKCNNYVQYFQGYYVNSRKSSKTFADITNTEICANSLFREKCNNYIQHFYVSARKTSINR